VVDVLLGFDLLDRQVLDRDGHPVGKVDDLELARTGDGAWYVAALLVGQQALGRRIGGWLGGLIANIAHRLSTAADPHPTRVPYDLVDAVNSAVHLSVRRELLPDAPLEDWLRDHLIARIPGARHAS
jgi:sporulation protein YlmC with PRC-barrel domain